MNAILVLSLGLPFLGFTAEDRDLLPLTEREQEQLRLEADLNDRVEIYVRATQQRLAKADADLAGGRTEAAMESLEDYQKLADAALQEIEKSSRKRKDKARAGKKLEIALRKGGNWIGDLKSHFSVDQMERLEEVRSSLEEMRKKLIVLIFDLEKGIKP